MSDARQFLGFTAVKGSEMKGKVTFSWQIVIAGLLIGYVIALAALVNLFSGLEGGPLVIYSFASSLILSSLLFWGLKLAHDDYVKQFNKQVEKNIIPLKKVLMELGYELPSSAVEILLRRNHLLIPSTSDSFEARLELVFPEGDDFAYLYGVQKAGNLTEIY